MKQRCNGCNKEFTIAEKIDAHWGHEPDCSNPDGCDCDLWYHPQCCPECKRESEVKKQEEKNTKQLTRVIAFMKSLGGLYADIADDAQEELDYYMRIEILYHERLDDLGLSEIYKK